MAEGLGWKSKHGSGVGADKVTLNTLDLFRKNVST